MSSRNSVKTDLPTKPWLVSFEDEYGTVTVHDFETQKEAIAFAEKEMEDVGETVEMTISLITAKVVRGIEIVRYPTGVGHGA